MATTRKLRAIPLTGPATTAALAANLEAVSASLVRAAQDLQDHLHAAVVAGMHEAPGSAGLDDTFKQWNASVAFGAAARQLSEKFFNVAAAPIVLLAASPAPRQGKQTKAIRCFIAQS